MTAESKGSKYDEKIEEVISKLLRRGFTDIKATIEPYEVPASIVGQNHESELIPDITAEKWGGKGYFEISKKDVDPSELASKWKVLELLAKMKSGEFQIYVPHGSMQFTQRIIDKYSIQAELVKI
ncbi:MULTISPECIES: hypothetical protein [Roseivirga]|uniref:Uncharacterized protein n=1 Tax=Roseivirga echinicomitans TaxID=296218 RepID=A0A150XPV1_9BACT|nr:MULTISPECIES: hypothetical protein [Roseivirga]KYG80760.1 hypothetical protein AWN68_16770 [Roseivirga echinicomitans]|tara:strand:- start:866 stop:1240 length:375 start_codon:yes stop_codon:yes gene_type:complete